MLDRLTADDFSQAGEAPYRVDLGAGQSLELVLESVAPAGDPRPFSLVFRGPIEPQLLQGIHPFAHPAFEEPLALFLVPIAREPDGMRYEVIFG